MPLVPAIFGGLGFGEMLVISFVAILVFGGRLPEVMRNLGRSYARFRQGLHDISRPIREELTDAVSHPSVAPPPTSTPTALSLPYGESPGGPPAEPPPTLPPTPAPAPHPQDWDDPPPV